MKLNRFKTIIHSVHAKLIVICLITWVCVILVVGSAMVVHRLNSIRPFYNNVVQYFTYVIEDLGDTPDRIRAKQILDRANLKISFKGEQEQWSLIEDFPEEKNIRYHSFSNSDTIFFGRFHGRHFAKFIHEKGTFIFEFAGYDKDEDPRHKWLHLLVLIFLTLIVIGAYFAIKKTLRPIKWLQRGVQEVGRGNLAHLVPENRKDEFGKLAAAFNNMTGQLKQMLNLKQQLLRDVSHELRSPLTRMKVALEFIDDAHDDQVKKSIDADIREVEAMVTAILENARLHHDHSTLEKKSADLTELVQDIVTGYENRPPGINLRDHSPVVFRFDPDRIKTVITNILENAIKYSSQESKPVAIHLKKEDAWVSVVIADNGIGMDKSKLPLVLEPFYRLDKSRSKKTGGFGLGLALCKTIMDAHGGKLEIDSSPGTGTNVILVLPFD